MADLTIADVRKKYPQYGDMSDQELGQALHSKFYSDMPYDEFASKIGLPSGKPSFRDTLDSGTNLGRTLKGYGEAALSIGTGLTTGTIGRIGGTIGGIAADITSGKYGTQEGAQMAGEVAAEQQQKYTYEPKTEEGKAALDSIARLFRDTKLEGLGPIAPQTTVEAVAARQPTRTAVGHAARVLRQNARDTAAAIGEREGTLTPEMAGMGSADKADAAMRISRAESLPAPIKLTKGQRERTFEQQQFEREAAKNPDIGAPLRQRYAEQNEKILQNFDAWLDQTGAEAGSLRATGEAVTNAVVAKSHKAKAEINAAYKVAREAGDMAERVDAAPISKYLDDNRAEAINAPLLSSVRAKLYGDMHSKGLVAKDGTMSINELEEVRKMVGRLSGKDATNALFGKEVKGVIDQMTEGKGGEAYKKARSLRFRYAQEFEDHAVVDKLLSFKPGTKDRAVAYEDVFSHSILKGSLDDVRTMRKTLQTSGKQGEQAWRELQGATIQHIKDEITKNVQVDQAGNRVISPAALNKIVTELDKDGKLDFIFGKQGAQQIRDVNGIAQDAFTAPPGAVNHSNTGSILLAVLDKVAAKTIGVPFVGSITNYASGEIRNAGVRKRVQEALE